MKEGDMIELRYIGRIKDSGEIFDLTEEDKAKEEGIYDSNINYKPINIIIGEGEVIEGLEDKLKEMEPEEENEFQISSDKAFGERDSDKIKTISTKKFRDNDVKPRRGSIVEVNGERGRILYRGSGRVKIDFNHPLSGKDLDYWVKVEKLIKGEEKARKIIENRLPGETNLEVEEGKAEIELPEEEDIGQEIKDKVSSLLKNYVEGVEEVEFS